MVSLPRRCVYNLHREFRIRGFPWQLRDFQRFFQALEGCQKTLGEDDLDDGFVPGLFVRIRIESEGFGRSGSNKSS